MNGFDGKVAVVAGATRGAWRCIAVSLGEAGAIVYVTGRTTREQRSSHDHPESIEETAELLDNDAWGGERLVEWEVALWKHDPDAGLLMLRLGVDTHADLQPRRAAGAAAATGKSRRRGHRWNTQL